jgi:hypothetical protein
VGKLEILYIGNDLEDGTDSPAIFEICIPERLQACDVFGVTCSAGHGFILADTGVHDMEAVYVRSGTR